MSETQMGKTYLRKIADSQLVGRIKSVFGQLDQIIYPPTCVGCGAFSTRHGALCPTCWESVQFIDKPYCAITGHPFSHDLGDGIISASAIADPPPYKIARAAVVYDGLARRMVHRFKYKDRTDLAGLMARWMIRAGGDCLYNADCIIPVPLHRWRLIGRKYNQSAEIARAIGKQLDVDFQPTTLLRTRPTKPQVGLAAKARQDNVRGAFSVRAEKKAAILGRRVVLVDDVFTTGATVETASRVLLRAGAEEVSVLTFARVVNEH